MTSDAPASVLAVGEWLADRSAGKLSRAGENQALEPKVMDLLFLLASRPNAVFSKPEILERLWPGVTVGEDSLARCVWKLRKALSDDPRSPRFVETIPKRGYRLIVAAPPQTAESGGRAARAGPAARRTLAVLAALALAIAAMFAATPALRHPAPPAAMSRAAILTRRADDFYFQFTRADNEAAIELYDRVIADSPDYAPALAGLANALVQRVVRWPNPPSQPDLPRTDLAGAIAQGRTSTPDARQRLRRALGLAERAVDLAPNDAAAQKALGSVYAAQSRFDPAVAAYRRAVALDPNAWGAMMELGDIAEIRGDRGAAIGYFVRTYAAMTRVYDAQAPRVRPWYAATGVAIANRYAESGAPREAETWYRRVLSQTPFQPAATSGLAALLIRSGDPAGAARLCDELVGRIGPSPSCAAVLRDARAGA